MTPDTQTKINRLCMQMLESARQLDILLMGKTAFSEDEDAKDEIRRQLNTFSFQRFIEKVQE